MKLFDLTLLWKLPSTWITALLGGVDVSSLLQLESGLISTTFMQRLVSVALQLAFWLFYFVLTIIAITTNSTVWVFAIFIFCSLYVECVYHAIHYVQRIQRDLESDVIIPARSKSLYLRIIDVFYSLLCLYPVSFVSTTFSGFMSVNAAFFITSGLFSLSCHSSKGDANLIRPSPFSPYYRLMWVAIFSVVGYYIPNSLFAQYWPLIANILVMCGTLSNPPELLTWIAEQLQLHCISGRNYVASLPFLVELAFLATIVLLGRLSSSLGLFSRFGSGILAVTLATLPIPLYRLGAVRHKTRSIATTQLLLPYVILVLCWLIGSLEIDLLLPITAIIGFLCFITGRFLFQPPIGTVPNSVEGRSPIFVLIPAVSRLLDITCSLLYTFTLPNAYQQQLDPLFVFHMTSLCLNTRIGSCITFAHWSLYKYDFSTLTCVFSSEYLVTIGANFTIANDRVLDLFILSIVIMKLGDLFGKLRFIAVKFLSLTFDLTLLLLVGQFPFTILAWLWSGLTETPLVSVLNCPFAYILGSLRPRRLTDFSIESEKGQGLQHIWVTFYDSLSDFVSRTLQPLLWISPGGMLLIKTDTLSAFVHIISQGYGGAVFQIRGLELEGTLCHNVELAVLENLDGTRFHKHMLLSGLGIYNMRYMGHLKMQTFSKSTIKVSTIYFDDNVSFFAHNITRAALILAADNPDLIKRLDFGNGIDQTVNTSRFSLNSFAPCHNFATFQERYSLMINEALRSHTLDRETISRWGWEVYRFVFGFRKSCTKPGLLSTVLSILWGQISLPESISPALNIVELALSVPFQMNIDVLAYAINIEAGETVLARRIRQICNTTDFQTTAPTSKPPRTDVQQILLLDNPMMPTIHQLIHTETKGHVMTINPHSFRHYWATQAMEILYYQVTDNERMSIQSNPTLLQNILCSAASKPVGYPLRVSPVNQASIFSAIPCKKPTEHTSIEESNNPLALRRL